MTRFAITLQIRKGVYYVASNLVGCSAKDPVKRSRRAKAANESPYMHMLCQCTACKRIRALTQWVKVRG